MGISDLTDTEFRAHLRATMPAANWTLHEMIEIERRGVAVLEPDPEMAEAFAARQDATNLRLIKNFVAKPSQARRRGRKPKVGIQLHNPLTGENTTLESIHTLDPPEDMNT